MASHLKAFRHHRYLVQVLVRVLEHEVQEEGHFLQLVLPVGELFWQGQVLSEPKNKKDHGKVCSVGNYGV